MIWKPGWNADPMHNHIPSFAPMLLSQLEKPAIILPHPKPLYKLPLNPAST